MTGWRYECHNGHVNVRRRTGGIRGGITATAPFYCDTCKKLGLSPFHATLRDKKTGSEVSV